MREIVTEYGNGHFPVIAGMEEWLAVMFPLKQSDYQSL